MKTNSKYPQLQLDNQLCFPLYACSRQIVSAYTPYLKPFKLTYTQYLVFLVLWEEDDIPVGDICSRLHLDNGTVTPLLKKMETEGYLIRTRSKEDERVVHITLTEKGRNLQDQVSDIPAQIGQCVALSKEDAMKLYELLYKLLEN